MTSRQANAQVATAVEERLPEGRVSSLDFFGGLNWIDSTPLLAHIEPYRRRRFAAVLDEYDETGRPRYNLALWVGRKEELEVDRPGAGVSLLPRGQRFTVGQSGLFARQRRGSSRRRPQSGEEADRGKPAAAEVGAGLLSSPSGR